MNISGKNNWVLLLPDVVDNCSNTLQASIKDTPNNLYAKHNQSQIDELVQNRKQIDKTFDNIIPVGSKVHVKLPSIVYKKGGGYYSKEVYIVDKVIRGSGTARDRYKLKLDNKLVKGFYNSTKLQVIDQIQTWPASFAKKNNKRTADEDISP